MKINPYSNFFCPLQNILDLENYKIHIKSNVGLDQRVYNTPSTSQVATIWVENHDFEENSLQEKIKWEIIVYNHSTYCHRVEYHYSCYDPLQYPLLYPCGDIDWHQGIERVDKRIKEPFCKDNLLINSYKMTFFDNLFDKKIKGPN